MRNRAAGLSLLALILVASLAASVGGRRGRGASAPAPGAAPGPPAPAALRSITCTMRHLPTSPLARRNLMAGLRRLDGLVIRPGETVRPAEVLGPWTDADFCFAPWEGSGPWIACFGAGLQQLGAALAAAARAAGLTVTSDPRAALSPSPLDESLALHNPTRTAAGVHATVEGGRPRVEIAPAPARGAAKSAAGETAPQNPLLLAAVGDIVCDPGAVPGLREVLSRQAGVPGADLLRCAPVTFGNLECPLTACRRPTPLKPPGPRERKTEFLFRGEPAPGTAVLRATGAKVLSLANNHVFDYGSEGIEDTCRTLEAAGLAHCGPAGDGTRASTVRVPLPGGALRFLSFTTSEALPPGAVAHLPRSWVLDVSPHGLAGARQELGAAVRAARAQGEMVVVSLHWGREGSTEPTVAQRELVGAAAAEGAALILGHHPHRLQPVDVFGGCVIAFSLGNFVFAPAKAEQALTGVLVVELRGGRVVAGAVSPVRIGVQGTGAGLPAALAEDDAQGREQILRDLGISEP